MNSTATEKGELKTFLDGTFRTLDNVLARQEAELRDREVGVVTYVGYGIVRVDGLAPFILERDYLSAIDPGAFGEAVAEDADGDTQYLVPG